MELAVLVALIIGGELVFHVRPPRRIDPRLVFRPIRNALREGGTKAHLKSCHTGEACSGREQGAAAHGKNGSRPSHYGTSPWAEGPRKGGRARCTESSVCVQALVETATLFEDVRDMRAAIERRVEARDQSETNVKEGRGTIREIEFTVQLLQLLFGAKRPELSMKSD